jgi:hypothetical protein
MSTETHNEKPYPHEVGRQSGGISAYSVEARYMYTDTLTVGSQVFDTRWRTVHFSESALVGVPRCGSHDWAIMATNLCSYQAAQALRWWFHADLAKDFRGSCLETRIVKHKINYSLDYSAESAHELITGDDRSNIMPDWGKKPEPATTPD